MPQSDSIPDSEAVDEPIASSAEGMAKPESNSAKPPEATFGTIMRVAGPLMLSFTGYMLMQFLDALFLSWHSEEAVAAVVPAAMACYMIMSAVLGVAGYTSTFVAQYVGAGRDERVGCAVWQGIYFALASGSVVAALWLVADTIFAWAGHDPAVRELEVQYFRILSLGAPAALLSSAVSGFFSGRGDTTTLMFIHGSGIILNGVLDYCLIFGAFGFPAWGVAGAATATVLAQVGGVSVMLLLFFRPRHRKAYGTWRNRAFEKDLFFRLLRYGFPNGLRFSIEMLAWTMFLFFIGRVGARELAVTNIAWRINGIAFFPLLGLSSATSILVGQAQGAERPDRSLSLTKRSLLLGQGWMLCCAGLFVVFPYPLLNLFHDPETVSVEAFAEMREMGVIILRYVALYCLLDAVNIILVGALQGAGDTRWTLVVAVVMNLVFLGVLIVMDANGVGAVAIWIAATAFVMMQSLVWLARFMSGRWKGMRVIEPSVVS